MRLLVRGYALGMVTVLVAVATLGYYLAGRTLSSGDQPPSLNPVPKGLAHIIQKGKTLQLKVYRVSNPRQYYFVQRQRLDTEGIWYAFSQPHDQGWNGQGLRAGVSVAFLDSQGVIMRILEVEPCHGSPKSCPLYPPGVVYSKVLEVRQDWFGQNGVQVGNLAVLNSLVSN